jgi:AraC-like DNA-binding protein
MSLAKDALRTTDRAIGELAFEFGYASESAFSMAFRREVGCSPRAYRDADGRRAPGKRRST